MEMSKPLPGNPNLERQIVATLCDPDGVGNKHYNIITECGLNATSFNDHNLRRIMIAAKNIHDSGNTIDLVTLGHPFINDHPMLNFLMQLSAEVASTANLSQWCRKQKEYETANKVLRVSKRLNDSILSGQPVSKTIESVYDKLHELQKSISLGGISADMQKKFNASLFDYSQEIEEPDYVFSIEVDGKWYGQACLGDIVVIGGASGSKKTTFLRGCMISGISNVPRNGWEVKLSESGMMAFIDTEQPFHRFQRTQKKIFDQSGIKETNKYIAASLRQFNKEDKLILIEKMLRENENIEVLVIDGIVDLIEDFNDNKSSGKIIDEIMRITDEYKVLLMTVLHTNPSTDKLRGHAGTILKQKADCYLYLSVDPKEFEMNGSTALSKVVVKKSRETIAPVHEFGLDGNWNVVRDGYKNTKIRKPIDDADTSWMNDDDNDLPF